MSGVLSPKNTRRPSNPFWGDLLRVLFIANGITSESGTQVIGGGEVRFIEIAKRWKAKGIDVQILTTEAGKELCEKLGLKADFHIMSAGVGTFMDYATTFLRSRLTSPIRDFEGILYSTTEHFYDCAPAFILRKTSPLWVAVVHWVAPLTRRMIGAVPSLIFYINQRLGLRYIKSRADLVLAVSEVVAKKLRKMGLNKRIKTVACGVDYEKIREISSTSVEKCYDAIYMKRFYPTKGIFDAVEIWHYVVEKKRDAKLLLVGFSPKPILKRVVSLIRERGLEGNITIKGPVYDFEQKILLLRRSRMLILPSYEENWGIVIGEALASGIAVIAYDLKDIRPIWGDNVIWCPLGDRKTFSKEILRLMNDDDLREELGSKGVELMKNYSWDSISNRELLMIQDHLRRRNPYIDT